MATPHGSGQARLSPAGLQAICIYEGIRLVPYLDSAGIWTYGVGAIRDMQGKRVTRLTPPLRSVDEAMLLLARDSILAAGGIDRLISAALRQNQVDALGSWIYNLGEARLRSSTLRGCINREEAERIREEWVKWCRAGGRVVQGLLVRRQAELLMWAACPQNGA